MKNISRQPQAEEPLISPSLSLPEITLRVLVIGTFLNIILAAANAYLGLKVGQTIAASIPAAIISMSILHFFKNANVLENTMVQTMVSIGSALIAGVTFILPALVILQAWQGFYYWQTVMIALLGGTLGVLFTIPLRRALLIDKTLRYPEAVAISNVFKATNSKEKGDMRILTVGGVVGAVISLCQTGFHILSETYYYWVKTTHTVVGFGLGLSPALLAAGYIVGVNVSLSILLGIIIGWVVGIPFFTGYYGMPDMDSATAIAMATWKAHTRYVGVGTMLVGGLWTLVALFKPIMSGLSTSLNSITAMNSAKKQIVLRTEKDIPMLVVFALIALLLIPIFLLIFNYLMPNDPGISHTFRLLLAAFSTLYILVGGLIFCSISAYFAGLIGSTNTPVSGLLVSSLLILCLIIIGFFKLQTGIAGHELLGVVLGIGTIVVIGGGLAISNDTMQDLKVGQIVGATPWKQQVMLILGAIVTSFVIPPILDLLYNAYGIGGAFPRPGMDPANMLAAPQAGLMAAVAEAVYANTLEWPTLGIGALIAVICIFFDERLKRRGARLPVLAVGVGIYLPLDASVPVVIGGLLSHFIHLKLNKKFSLHKAQSEFKIALHKHRGLMLACGLVAGASVMGVILAIPFALLQSSNALNILPEKYEHLAQLAGLAVTALLCVWIYRTVMRVQKKNS